MFHTDAGKLVVANLRTKRLHRARIEPTTYECSSSVLLLVVLEPNVAGEALWTCGFCGVIVATLLVLAVRGLVSPAVAIGSAAVCGVIALLVAMYARSETRKGPWLRFDRVRRRLTLPRWAIELDADARTAWETKQVHWDVGGETTPATELRLVVRSASDETRYVILACRTHRAVRELAEKLARLTALTCREADDHAPSGGRS